MNAAIGTIKGKVFNIFESEFDGVKKKNFQVSQVDKKGRASLVNISSKTGLPWKVGEEISVEGRFYAYSTDNGQAQLGFSVM